MAGGLNTATHAAMKAETTAHSSVWALQRSHARVRRRCRFPVLEKTLKFLQIAESDIFCSVLWSCVVALRAVPMLSRLFRAVHRASCADVSCVSCWYPLRCHVFIIAFARPAREAVSVIFFGLLLTRILLLVVDAVLSSFWLLFEMFSAPELHFGYYLQCFLLVSFILDVIYNVFCSSPAFWLLFVMFSAPEVHFGCYLQFFGALIFILVAIYNVSCSSPAFGLLFAMFSAPRPHFGCYLQCFLLLGSILVAI